MVVHDSVIHNGDVIHVAVHFIKMSFSLNIYCEVLNCAVFGDGIFSPFSVLEISQLNQTLLSGQPPKTFFCSLRLLSGTLQTLSSQSIACTDPFMAANSGFQSPRASTMTSIRFPYSTGVHLSRSSTHSCEHETQTFCFETNAKWLWSLFLCHREASDVQDCIA